MTIIRQAFEALQERDLLIQEKMSTYNTNRMAWLSSGGLSTARNKSLADLRMQQTHPSDVDSSAFLEGRAIHTLTLEGDSEYLKSYHIGAPINKSTGREVGFDTKAFREAARYYASQGKQMVTRAMHDRASIIRKSCLSHPVMSDVLSEGVAERVIRVRYLDVDCQIRIDWLSPVYGICDLKTCADLTRFERDARFRFGYLNSAAFYRAVMREVAPEFGNMPYSFLAVEKEPPFKAGVFLVDENLLDVYEKANAITIEEIAVAQRSGVWSTGFEDLQHITT